MANRAISLDIRQHLCQCSQTMTDKTPTTSVKIEHTVRQKDAAILREALSWVMKHSHPLVAKHVDKALKQYANTVKPYCSHAQQAYVAVENMNACLDCGTRSTVSEVDRTPHALKPVK